MGLQIETSEVIPWGRSIADEEDQEGGQHLVHQLSELGQSH